MRRREAERQERRAREGLAALERLAQGSALWARVLAAAREAGISQVQADALVKADKLARRAARAAK